MPECVSLSGDRLRYIEQTAAKARLVAAERLESLGIPYDRTTDLRVVASVLINGPVDAVQNLRGLGAGRLAGRLDCLSSSARISFDQHDPPSRQRFSIAHELGHFFLHTPTDSATLTECSADAGEDGDWREAEGTVDQEKEANVFAAFFLLPACDLDADLDRFGLCVSFLAERYGLSEEVIRRRLDLARQMVSRAP